MVFTKSIIVKRVLQRKGLKDLLVLKATLVPQVRKGRQDQKETQDLSVHKGREE